MSKAVLGLGSNTPDAEAKIIAAQNLLGEKSTVVSASALYTVTAPYFNMVLVLETSMDPGSLIKDVKAIECRLGRLPEMKKTGEVPIDIDVVIYNGEVLRARDFKEEYFSRGYHEISDKAM